MTIQAQDTMTQTLDTLSGHYSIDVAHSRVGFVARHAMVTKVRGQFNAFDGRAYLDFANPGNSSVELTIDVASVDTNNAQRDAHLRANDFFAVDAHPQITFRSTGVEQVGEDRYRLAGDLTIKGISKPVTLDLEYTGTAKDPFGNTRVGLEGSTTINRRDWGVEWNAPLDTGGVLVSEKVTLEFEISAVQVQPAA